MPVYITLSTRKSENSGDQIGCVSSAEMQVRRAAPGPRRSGPRLDEDLRRRAVAEAEALAALQAEVDGVGRLVARLDREAAPRLQTPALDEEEEVARLVAHPR